MKYLLLSTSLLAIACQPQSSTTQANAAGQTAGIVGSASAAPLARAEAPAGGLAAVETLSPELLEIVRTHDLSPLLQTVNSDYAHAQNGFFGRSHYRIEFAFTEVRRDPANPTVYFLRGKDRYKGVITPFSGTFTVSRFGRNSPYSQAQKARFRKSSAMNDSSSLMNSTEGRFELREDPSQKGAGIFRGQLNIDWSVSQGGLPELDYRSDEMPSQRGGIKYEGTWTNSTTHRTYPVVWVEEIFSYNAQQNVLDEFDVGERGPQVNPKYARLGWNDYWDNQEWWADSKHPAKPKETVETAAEPGSDSLGLGI